MITYKNNIFHIQGEGFSSLMRINKYGQLEQLHFGAPIEMEDAQALEYHTGLGWGSSILLDDNDLASCSDVIPYAWSGNGRGDYREAPVEIGKSTEFKYKCHKIYQGIAPFKCTLPQAKGECDTLEIHMEQTGLLLKLYFSVFGGVLIRRVVLTNTSEKPVEIQKLMSFMMDIYGDYEVTSFHGSWISEMRDSRQLVQGGRIVNESLTGFSSNQHHPGFLVGELDATEDNGNVYGINLIYSGNHYASVQKSYQGLTRIMQGISPNNFSKKLAPKASFETPEAVICFSDKGYGGMSEKMHAFVNKHIIPEYWQNRERPVLYNSWEGCMFDFDQRRLLGLAKTAKDLGCEMFVLDDGWFGKRNDDKAGLGDYSINKKKLPNGMDGFANKIHDLGLQFGLWFEPESVNMDSDLYRAHPDWALTDEFNPILGRHQLLLDLTKKEVRDYIVENVGKVLDNANINYVKWDMNRHSIALGAKAHDYILGLYDVQRRVFEPRPQILLENCASGGNRFDLGMLCMGPQIWCSDDTDPIERLTIQGNLSYLYPQSTYGTHVSAAPHAQTLRVTPLVTRGNVSFFGCLGYELDLKHLLSLEKAEIKAQIAFYKKYRSVFQYGTFKRLKNGWQVSQGKTTIAGVFRKQISAAPGYEQLRVKDLDRAKHYQLANREQKLRVGQFGALIKHVVPVNLNPNGAILRTADRKITMDDGKLELTASGAALMSGIPLLPIFQGTGYDKNQRTQTDFGSEVYVMEEVNKS